MNGTVIRVIAEKGYGFIRVEDGNDEYFFHKDDLNGYWDDLVIDLNKGRKIEVEFDDVPSSKGLRAGEVRRLDGGV